jgi:hypothetical protein
MSLPDLHTLWIGPRLTWLERLSLCSCLANGHHVILWCYELIEGVPDGVQLADAQAILPKSSITYHRESGSVTYFANRFRYHLLRRQPATWLDADIVLLRPLATARPHSGKEEDFQLFMALHSAIAICLGLGIGIKVSERSFL